MLKSVPFERILFLDIETVSQYSDYGSLPREAKPLWKQKGLRFARQDNLEWDEDVAASTYGERAGIFAEFGKIAVISCGFVFEGSEGTSIKLKSFTNPDEKLLLEEFANLLNGHYKNSAQSMLCGHNIKEFDVPYICRRMVIHGMALPDILNVTGKKPWETEHLLDTMLLWKFGDFKNYTSLQLLAYLMDVPTPKDDIDGSQVGQVYWHERDIDRIARYCEKDVATVVQLLRRFQRLSLIPGERIRSVTNFAE